ncbi:MAG: hypothetical protein H6742_00115 [Alphaproteobacteria bacterium]|nr:hypothetical protein [Alphaproteobacteria bacterium]
MLLLLSSLAVAAAAPVLVSDWGGTVRYHHEALVSTPESFLYLGVKNLDARAVRHEIALDTTCTGVPASRGWNVECTLDRVALAGAAYPGDQDDLDAILAEYGRLMTGQVVQLVVSDDGRITTVDLEGVGKQDDRMAEIHEAQRQLLRRAFAPLDLGLPRKGVAKARGWKQKGQPLMFELMTAYGTAGGSTMGHELGDEQGGGVVITSFGRGNVGTGLDFELGAGQMINLIGAGTARFSADDGRVLWREITVTGEYTAQSIQVGDITAYGLAAWVGVLHDDGTIEQQHGPG